MASTSDQRLRLCMIGAGGHASSMIYPYFHYLADDAQVVANCDLDRDRAETVGRRFGINAHYTDYVEMVEAHRPDGVMVCIGDRAHAELAIDLMQRGYHVYTEKPHAPSLERSEQMLETAKRTGRICMAAFKKRFAPCYQKARAIIADQSFGRPTYLKIHRSVGGGGLGRDPQYLWQWGCHAIDLICYLFGPVAQVSCEKADVEWRAVAANLRFVSGAVGHLALTSPGGNWEDVTALGEGMNAIKVDGALFTTQYSGNDPCAGYIPSFAASRDGGVEMGFVGELRAFVEAIREGHQPDANIATSTHTLALHEAMRRSIETGQCESVEQYDPADLPEPTRKPAGE